MELLASLPVARPLCRKGESMEGKGKVMEEVVKEEEPHFKSPPRVTTLSLTPGRLCMRERVGIGEGGAERDRG